MGGVVQAADAIEAKAGEEPDTNSEDTAEKVLKDVDDFINEIKDERWGHIYDNWLECSYSDPEESGFRLTDMFHPERMTEVSSVSDAREDAFQKLEKMKTLNWGVLTAMKERFAACAEIGDEISTGYKQAQSELEPVWKGDGANAAYDKFDEASGGGIRYKDANAALAGALDGYITATRPAIESLAKEYGRGSGGYDFVTWCGNQNYDDWGAKAGALGDWSRDYPTIDDSYAHYEADDDEEGRVSFSGGDVNFYDTYYCEHIQDGMKYWDEFCNWVGRFRSFAPAYSSHVLTFAYHVDNVYKLMTDAAKALEDAVKPFIRERENGKITMSPFKDFAEYGPKAEEPGEAGSGVDKKEKGGVDTGGSDTGGSGTDTGGGGGGPVGGGGAPAGPPVQPAGTPAAATPEPGTTGAAPAPEPAGQQDTTVVKQGESEISMTEPAKTGEMTVGVDDGKGGTKNYKLDFDPENNPQNGKDETAGAGAGAAGGGYGAPGTGGKDAPGGKASPEDEVHTPGEDGKIRIKDGDLEIVAEQPLGPDGATVVTVDDGKGEPTTQILGDKEDVDEYKRLLHEDQQRLTGYRDELEGRENVSKADWDELKKAEESFRERGGDLPDDDGKHAEKVSDGQRAGEEERSAPKSVFDEAEKESKSSGGLGKSAFEEAKAGGGSGASGFGGGGGGAAPGIGGSVADLDQGARSGVGAPPAAGGAGVGTAPGAEPAAASSGASRGMAGAGAGMMGGGMMGGGMGAGGGGDDQRSGNSAYQVHGGLFEPEVNEGPFGVARISGSLDDEE